jgi:hypothetical protein
VAAYDQDGCLEARLSFPARELRVWPHTVPHHPRTGLRGHATCASVDVATSTSNRVMGGDVVEVEVEV